MSDFFNDIMKNGALDSLTADQLDELIIRAQAIKSEHQNTKEEEIIDMIKNQHSYGNQYRLGDLETHIIILPIKADGTPDYDFMEQYMKSLPFSKVLEKMTKAQRSTDFVPLSYNFGNILYTYQKNIVIFGGLML